MQPSLVRTTLGETYIRQRAKKAPADDICGSAVSSEGDGVEMASDGRVMSPGRTARGKQACGSARPRRHDPLARTSNLVGTTARAVCESQHQVNSSITVRRVRRTGEEDHHL